MAINLTEMTNILFTKRELWHTVTEDDKKSNFFIVNRFLSKKYPELSSKLNYKTSDPVTGMNCWYIYMEGKPYPRWIWSKGHKVKEKELTKAKKQELMEKFQLDKEEDLLYLIKNFKGHVKEYLK